MTRAVTTPSLSSTVASPDLPPVQARVFLEVVYCHREPGLIASAPFIARRLGLSRSTIRKHFMDLFRKEWLDSPFSPARPGPRARPWLARS